MSGISKEFADGIKNYLDYFIAQVLIDAFLNEMHVGWAGYLVDAGFILLTLYGFWQELRSTLSARGVVRFVLALFALGLDIWLNLTIR